MQVLGLRDSGETFRDRNVRPPSVEAIFSEPAKYLSSFEKSEQWNLYYTVCQIGQSRKEFVSQYVIPIDIDNIETTDIKVMEKIAREVCSILGVKFEQTGVLFSGNGLQIIVATTTEWTDKEYFETMRPFYKGMCARIEDRLGSLGFKGKLDTSVWASGHLMRYPETLNRKPHGERWGILLQGKIERVAFDLKKVSGLPLLQIEDSVAKAVMDAFPTPDAKAIMAECQFLKFCQVSPEKVTEPEWYAALSITARFPDGVKFSHQISKGHPSYSVGNCERKIQQALESSYPRTCKNIESISNKCVGCKHHNTKTHSPITIVGPDHIRTKNTGFHHVFVDDQGNKKIKKPAYTDLMKYFASLHPFKAAGGVIWRFTGTHYELTPKEEILAFAYKNFQPETEDHVWRKFLSLMQINNIVSPDWFTQSIDGKMNFSNGVLDIKTHTMTTHSSNFGFRSVLPCAYDEKAECPTFEQFMRDVTCNDASLIAIVQEFMGYIFSNSACKYQKMLMLVGEGANGKSTLMNIIRKLAGKEGTSNLSVKNLSEPNSCALLEGKIVNIAEENSTGAFRDTDILKNLATGGILQVHRFYLDRYEIEVRAKMVILCNTVPKSIDATYGFLRRFLMVPFNAEFSHAANNVDLLMEQKLVQELPGIFNWALEGWVRLERQGYFTPSQAAEGLLGEYRLGIDPVWAWFNESCLVVSEGHTLRQDLYNNYDQWCRTNGEKYVTSSNHFFKSLRGMLKKRGYEMREERPRAGDRKRVVHNIVLQEGAKF